MKAFAITRHSKIIGIFCFAIVFIACIWLITVGYSASIETLPSAGHQAIKAKVINEDPAFFTINVKNLANFGANDTAPTFAVYVSSRLPKQCGNFLKLNLKYTRPEKHHRRFDLSKHPEFLEALNVYKCVIIKNITSE